jgi:tRNA(Arg) A34 adenosine deaminase TadA
VPHPAVHIEYPEWVDEVVDWARAYTTDEDRMRLAVAVARANVEHGLGGPFGSAIFEAPSGRLIAVGMNLVVRLQNSVLHGEMVAFMMAERRAGSFSLNARGMPAHELFTSCEPCAMCLGGVLWSGVARVVSGASREDVLGLHFDEGPVFPESYAYLEARGIRFVRGVLRAEATAVLDLYRAKGGTVY